MLVYNVSCSKAESRVSIWHKVFLAHVIWTPWVSLRQSIAFTVSNYEFFTYVEAVDTLLCVILEDM